jgi:hypothetical protein
VFQIVADESPTFTSEVDFKSQHCEVPQQLLVFLAYLQHLHAQLNYVDALRGSFYCFKHPFFTVLFR